MVKWASVDHSSQGPGFTIKLTVDPQGESIKSIIQDPLTVYEKCPPSQPQVTSSNGWGASLKAGPMVYVKGPATQNDVTFTFEVSMAREPCLTWNLRIQRADNSLLPPLKYTVEARKAVTYGFKQNFPAPQAHPKSNASLVGCGTPNSGACNAIDGDTQCLQERPLLCIAKTPNQPIPNIPALKNNWSGGRLGTTQKSFKGFDFRTRADADAACKAEFNN